MKTKLLYKRIPLQEPASAQDDLQIIEFDPMDLYEQSPHGYRANKSTLQYRFTDTHLVISCELVPNEHSEKFSEARAD